MNLVLLQILIFKLDALKFLVCTESVQLVIYNRPENANWKGEFHKFPDPAVYTSQLIYNVGQIFAKRGVKNFFEILAKLSFFTVLNFHSDQ